MTSPPTAEILGTRAQYGSDITGGSNFRTAFLLWHYQVPRSDMRTITSLIVTIMAILLLPVGASATDCCQMEEGYQMIWSGSDSTMTFAELAAYCGPILWYSPDEPNLEGTQGKDIRMPTNFPFEPDLDSSLVYYRVRTVLKRGNKQGEVIVNEDPERIDTMMNLAQVVGFDLDYFFYYPRSENTRYRLLSWRYFALYCCCCNGA